jgi:hypothetical protein
MSDTVDPYWNYIKTNPDRGIQRVAIERMRERYLPYCDANFDTELNTHFGSCFWEMYLASCLLDRGMQLIPRSERQAAGPDFCIRDGVRRIWIEAVAPGPGNGADMVPSPRIGTASMIPVEEIVLRYRNAVGEKDKKWTKYTEEGIVGTDEPYVVALNGFQIPWNDIYSEIPYEIQSVLPLGSPTIISNRDTGEIIDEGFETRWTITKKNKAQVRTDVFLDDTYAGISGLLFSNAHPLHPSGSGIAPLSHLHNPNAIGSKALPRGWIQIGTEYWVEGNQLLSRRVQEEQ